MSVVLGISAHYHDAAAAIVRDGVPVAAAQEERFSRRKHDAAFPRHAINYCLEEAFVEPDELDAVIFYEDPLMKIDRVVRVAAAHPHSRERIPVVALGTEPFVDQELRETVGVERPMLVTEHHAAHAAAAFFPSPFGSAAILTLDGVGEWATATIGAGAGPRVELLREMRYPHSLGLLYAAVTEFCGFRVNSDEYKVMGLAAYGKPRFEATILSELVSLGDDGSLRLNLDYFDFVDGDAMASRRLAELFEGPARAPGAAVTQRDADLAASIQSVTEEAMLRLARLARALTGERNLALAGGVALNAVANGRLAAAGIFDAVWVQPAAGDAGGAMGAALLGAYHGLGESRSAADQPSDRQSGSLLGPAFSSAEVHAFLDRVQQPSTRVDPGERARVVAERLAAGATVGLVAGRMEFGPRALGARSILADPRDASMRRRLNERIKHREEFRPFAPAVLAEHAGDLFELDRPSPYMLRVVPVRPAGRELIPAAVHADGSARVQTVAAGAGPLRDVLEAFFELTGCAALLNTSFNLSDEPIVCTPDEAWSTFRRGGLDMLVLEDFLIEASDAAEVDCDAPTPAPDHAAAERPNGDWLALAARLADAAGDPGSDAGPTTLLERVPTVTLRPHTSADLGGALKGLWQATGDDSLADLADDVADVAGSLRGGAGSAAQYPNLYPMF
jgi:carbamoyltransferase